MGNSDEIESSIVIGVGHSPYGIVITKDGRKLFVANSGDDTISVIDTKTNKLIGNPILVGDGPTNMIISEKRNRVYVTNFWDGTVSCINTKSNKVIGKPIQVGRFPYNITIPKNEMKAYVTNFFIGSISSINLSVNRIISKGIEGGWEPIGIVSSPEGEKIYYVDMTWGNLNVINIKKSTNTPVLHIEDDLLSMAITPDGKLLYIGGSYGKVYVVKTAGFSIITTIEVSDNKLWNITISGRGDKAYVTDFWNNRIIEINIKTNKIDKLIKVGVNPWGITLTGDGKYAYVTNNGDDTLSVVNLKI